MLELSHFLAQEDRDLAILGEDLPERLLPEIVSSGTRLGTVTDEIKAETGLQDVQTVATCSHDTGAAVAAVPAQEGGDWAYLSSGTWSLIGVALPEPGAAPFGNGTLRKSANEAMKSIWETSASVVPKRTFAPKLSADSADADFRSVDFSRNTISPTVF